MVRARDEEVETLDQLLKGRTVPGAIYEQLEQGKVRCYACGHRCTIPDGRDGICRVRFNRGGTLYVPRGYVAGLQVDPIEKKPFFHAFPGAVALSFGMLGCDLHCSYCFAPGTRVLTDRGHLPIEQLDAETRAFTHLGRPRAGVTLFRRPYQGRLVRLRPAGLPAIEATPEHPFLATARPARGEAPVSPRFLPAAELTREHLLAVPRRFEFSEAVTIHPAAILGPQAGEFTTRHRRIGAETLRTILQETSRGTSSRGIAARLGKSPSHIRHLRCKLARGTWSLETLETRATQVVCEEGTVRFSKEHRPGIPAEIPLQAGFARLLGLYCAEGSVSRDRGRRHAATVVFSFGRHELALVAETEGLLTGLLGVTPRRVERKTTLAVEVGKASAALLFESLCGTGARAKRVPETLFRCHRPVAEAFLEGYAAGDGHVSPDGTVRTGTVSEDLAAGVAGLVLKLGHLPQWYCYQQPVQRDIQGRSVGQCARTYVVRWNPRRAPAGVIETADYWLVPIREIEGRDYDGPVYNWEVDEDHTYLANGVAVHNCQNWLTSQALRDPAALSPPRDIEPAEIVELARRTGAPAMVSTYNEPLITSEWAIEVFRQAKPAGIACGYVSNGNGTPEVLAALRPWVDLYKVDLKSFRDPAYRKLGAELNNVTDTIERLWRMGFWVEIVTLVVPGFNDSDEELTDIARFLVSVSPDIPWHVTAFHKDYKMTDPADTTARDLLRAAAIGKQAGLRYVYAGNLPGRVGDWENTRCPSCSALLVERYGYKILSYRLADPGHCPDCGTKIAGFWRSGWQVPPDDGGLPGRRPRALWVEPARNPRTPE